jgi:AmmeMemoRadiSam system protein B/AmmeMemoRadiSam system protein A
MGSIRQAAVAGQFYPGSRARLEEEVDTLLADVGTDAPCPKVLVAPHAGYVYSGPVAAQAYARLRNGAHRIARVLLLGPAHRVGFRGIAVSTADRYRTPLGEVALDADATSRIRDLPGVHTRDDAHALEHSLEVHLPFLQRCLGEFSLVPLVVGDAPPDQVARVIEALWGGPETLVVISTDLSHFLSYDAARATDAETCRHIEALDATISGEQACGCRPLNGLLRVLGARQLQIETVAMQNSGDTAGSRERVVGYGAWVVNEPARTAPGTGSGSVPAATETINLPQRQQLLHLARQAISHGLAGGGELQITNSHFHERLQAHRSSFVTLNLAGRLRGCIGNLAATRPLFLDVAENALAAAFRDPRFKPVRVEEYPELEVHISVLSPSTRLAVDSREALEEFLIPGVHGVILEEAGKRATYLPSVWEKLSTPASFINELRVKAGLPRHGWSTETRVSVYTSEEFA